MYFQVNLVLLHIVKKFKFDVQFFSKYQFAIFFFGVSYYIFVILH